MGEPSDNDIVRESGVNEQFAKDLRGISPLEDMLNTVALEEARKKYEKDMGFDIGPPDYFASGGKVTGYRVITEAGEPFIISANDMSEEEFEKLKARWQELGPSARQIVTTIDQPMEYKRMGMSVEMIVDKSHREPDGTLVIDEAHLGSWEPVPFIVTKEILHDDGTREILETQCPSTLEINDSTGSGWSGPLGDELRCELPLGHYPTTDHQYIAKWDDLMASGE